MSALRPTAVALLCAAAGAAWAEARVSIVIPSNGINSTQTGAVAASNAQSTTSPFLTGEASGSANLADGTLRVSVGVTPQGPGVVGNNTVATAGFDDGLTLVGAAGSPVAISFRMDLAAQFLTGGPITSGSETLGLNAVMRLEGPGALSQAASNMGITRFLRYANGNVAASTIQCAGTDCTFDTPLTLAGIVDGFIVHDALVQPNTPFTFIAQLQAVTSGAPGLFEGIDAGHTARLSVLLPAGYTLASASGAFLSAVPEPAPWALLAAGGAVLALRRAGSRRGRHARAASRA